MIIFIIEMDRGSTAFRQHLRRNALRIPAIPRQVNQLNIREKGGNQPPPNLT